MTKITANVDGMRCSMCEAHLNDTIRKAFDVKKVTASHTKGQVIIIAREDITAEALKAAVDPTGYVISDIRMEPYEKKGLFSRL